MPNILEIVNKSCRKIHLSKERWRHIRKKHPEVEEIEEIRETINNPDKIAQSFDDEAVYHYYKYFKRKKSPFNYLLVLVKYLNNHGYVISAYFEKHIT